jgi:hypothetical protein
MVYCCVVTLLLRTFIAGVPKTKGSLRVRNAKTGALTEGVKGSSDWRALVAGGVRDAYQALNPQRFAIAPRPPSIGPVAVRADFELPVDPLQVRAGDLDKLLRNLLDALASDARNPRYNGGVIVNDNQVAGLYASKSGPHRHPGLRVEVYTLPLPRPLDQSHTHGTLEP